MPPAAVATPLLLTDPGYLFVAPLGTADPTHTVAGSVFTDAWAGAWVPVGATVDGSQLSYEINVEPIAVAEFFDAIKFVTTSRAGSFAFNMADYTARHLQIAWNGGVAALTPVSGTGATALTKVEPPNPGAELRIAIGWESLDNTVRLVARQCIQGGQVQTSFQKAPAFASIPTSFNFEVPSAAKPFSIWTAGTSRAG